MPIDQKDPVIVAILDRLAFLEKRVGPYAPGVVPWGADPSLRINIATDASLPDVIEALKTVDESVKSDPLFPADGKFIPNATSPVMPWGAGPRPEGFVDPVYPSIVGKDAAPEVTESAPATIVDKPAKKAKTSAAPAADSSDSQK